MVWNSRDSLKGTPIESQSTRPQIHNLRFFIELRKSGLVIVGNRTILGEGSEDFFQLAVDLSERGNLISASEFRGRR